MHSDGKKRRSFLALLLPPVICGVTISSANLSFLALLKSKDFDK
jgi:hypothetical protein